MVRGRASDEGHRENDSVTQVAMRRAIVCVRASARASQCVLSGYEASMHEHVQCVCISISRHAKMQVCV